jgi:HPt (histidine-containing phosphotransfer) domain-containing protein
MLGQGLPQLDLDLLRELGSLEGDEEGLKFLQELTAIFLQDTSRLVPELGKSLVMGDASTAQKLAHRLKGSCGNIGARRMEELCSHMEMTLKRGSPLVEVNSFFSDLEIEFIKVTELLTKMMANPSVIFEMHE